MVVPFIHISPMVTHPHTYGQHYLIAFRIIKYINNNIKKEDMKLGGEQWQAPGRAGRR